MDLVEAAVRAGRREEAAAHALAMQEAGIAKLSPRLAFLSAGATALAASPDPPDHAGKLFRHALAMPGATGWPFEYARLQLAFGEHLRAGGETAGARRQLKAALQTFTRLGARPWARRAAVEARAAGQNTPQLLALAPQALTEQEQEVVLLAAAGLTNKQIGHRLFLSNRTVGAHLYRAFPKLGVTSRASLGGALASLPARGQTGPRYDIG
jgi:DNA-binding CsgD family transcriptional regulator